MILHPWLGINISLSPWYTKKNIDTIINHLIDLGIEWVRREFDFFSSSHNTRIEHYAIEQFTQHKIKILWMLSGNIPWNLNNLLGLRSQHHPVYENIKEYKKFIYNTTKKYKSCIYHRQIWNEPNTKRFWINTPNPQEYVHLIQESVGIIKKEQPSAIIISWWIFYDPSQVFLPNYNKEFIKECITLWIDKYIDIYAIHPYSLSCYIWHQSSKKLITTTINNIHQRTQKSSLSSKKIRVTEFWISSQRTYYNDKEKTLIYQTLYHYLQQHNIPFFIRNIVDFKDNRHEWGNPEKSFWLLDENFKSKTVFYEFKKLLENKK